MQNKIPDEKKKIVEAIYRCLKKHADNVIVEIDEDEEVVIIAFVDDYIDVFHGYRLDEIVEPYTKIREKCVEELESAGYKYIEHFYPHFDTNFRVAVGFFVPL